MANRPATAIRIASTEAKIGRSMNTEEMFMAHFPFAGAAGFLVRGDFGVTLSSLQSGRHDDAGMHALRAVHDDHVTRLEALAHDAQAFDHATQLHPPVFDLVARAEQEHVFLALIGVYRAIVDQHRGVFAAAQQLHPREQTGNVESVLVRQHGAGADRAGLRIDLVVHEVHLALVRESPPRSPIPPARDLGASRELGRSPATGQRDVTQIGRLVALEIEIDRVHGHDRGQKRAAVVPAR